ncbi:Hypothetical Protein FCC1311_021312 [Hondaea fermentalgiana]|uniref:Uncharacterized protein n=1 Tax=Hondaea fermentalgiana TaxID=2315210 RepID=A0A2R5G4G1_9STRA|nr:Hypothetical Protein FCC1311_021312 [Hondaea fermentalgiana]|eukprot:GBG25912.1 Hypothetical Protein FCC1311_021312 [Hondaea fermentalgiana]
MNAWHASQLLAEEEEEAGMAGTQKKARNSPGDVQAYRRQEGPVLTVLTGTHATNASNTLQVSSQSVKCQAVNEAMRGLWTQFSDGLHYVKAKEALISALSKLDPTDRCTFSSTARNYQYTFPMAIKPSQRCSLQVARELANRKYLMGPTGEPATRITVPWFLLRPDLVTLERLCHKTGVRVRYLVTVGHDTATAAFSNEGCPRFNTLLAKRGVYKEILLLVALSDLSHQLGKLQYAEVIVSECRATSRVKRLLHDSRLETSSASARVRAKFLNNEELSEPALKCFRSPIGDRLDVVSKSHVPSILANELFLGEKLKKTVFAGSSTDPDTKIPTVVFVAGVEGSGHHMMSTLGRKHTTRELYDTLTDYLADSRWRDDSLEEHGPARERLVNVLRGLHNTNTSDGSKLFFLNTVFTEAAVNMYSYPWGGPRCYMKKFARPICNIDLYELVKIGEEAGVDFRVVVLRRALGAAIVSSSINRNFGTVNSQTRSLGMSWSLLRESLRSIDDAFIEQFNYEDLIKQPLEECPRLVKHLNVDPESPLGQHFNETLMQSYLEFGKKNTDSWKVKLTDNQFTLISDMLYFPEELIDDFNTEEAIILRAGRAAKVAAEVANSGKGLSDEEVARLALIAQNNAIAKARADLASKSADSAS